jgi:hypothetical protein
VGWDIEKSGEFNRAKDYIIEYENDAKRGKTYALL